LGVTTRILQKYETDGAPLSRADDLAEALQVAPKFFTRPALSTISTEQGFFRARRRATAGQLGAARATASIGTEFYDWIADHFTLPPMAVPDMDQYDPESAAAALRATWGRGEGPSPNLVQLSE